MNARCEELRVKIQGITDSDYSASKREVDRLRQELGQEPLPNLQHMLEEKSAAYLKGRRLDAGDAKKRAAGTPRPEDGSDSPAKRPRGRPKGSRNKPSAGPANKSVMTAEDVDSAA